MYGIRRKVYRKNDKENWKAMKRLNVKSFYGKGNIPFLAKNYQCPLVCRDISILFAQCMFYYLLTGCKGEPKKTSKWQQKISDFMLCIFSSIFLAIHTFDDGKPHHQGAKAMTLHFLFGHQINGFYVSSRTNITHEYLTKILLTNVKDQENRNS